MGSIFGAFFAIVLLFIAGIIVLIVYVVKQSTKPQTQVQAQSEQQQMMANVQRMKSELVPWGNHSYTDITTGMKFSYSKGFAHRLRGKIFSVNREPIIAFDRVERGMKANGCMVAGATNFDLYYDIRVNEFTIWLNGQLLGDIRANGDLIDHNGQAIGNALHPTKVSFSVGPFGGRAGNKTFPLHMHGRQLATINVAPNYGEGISMNVVFNENNWGGRVLQLHDQPTPVEERWLIAFAVLETGFHGHWLV